MIHKSQAHKYYDRNTKVIHKGERGWKSDAAREIEMAERTPGLESTVVTKSTHRPRYEDSYMDYLYEVLDSLSESERAELDGEIQIAVGNDVVKFVERDGVWKRRWVHRGGALL
jgi:hypothetical protein